MNVHLKISGPLVVSFKTETTNKFLVDVNNANITDEAPIANQK